MLMSLSLASCAVKDEKIVVQLLSSPAAERSAEPFLFTDNTGSVFLSWIEKRDTISFLKYAQLEGDIWSQPVSIDSGTNWFVNWADYPVMTGSGKHFIANILQKSNDETYAYDVKLLSSFDGLIWNRAGLLHHDSVQAEHGFVSLVPFQEGVFATWLDGRNTEGGGHDHEGHQGAMSLRAAILDYDGKKMDEWELDNRVCDCCQTTAAITTNGPVVIYRDRSEEEVRDMSIVRLVNGTWTKPKPIYSDQWKINGCPVNGPRCEAINNALAVAWFSSANDQPEVKVIFSNDGGATFGGPIRIDEGNTMGRVDLVLLDEQRALVSWMEGSDIKVVMVSSDGKKQLPMTVARSSESRSSGFPQLTKRGEDIIMAWTDDSLRTIKTAVLK
jgi:hypothetical protein